MKLSKVSGYAALEYRWMFVRGGSRAVRILYVHAFVRRGRKTLSVASINPKRELHSIWKESGKDVMPKDDY